MLEQEIFQTAFVGKIKVLIWCSMAFFKKKYCRWWDNVEKSCTAEQVTYDNVFHAHFMLDT